MSHDGFYGNFFTLKLRGICFIQVLKLFSPLQKKDGYFQFVPNFGPITQYNGKQSNYA